MKLKNLEGDTAVVSNGSLLLGNFSVRPVRKTPIERTLTFLTMTDEEVEEFLTLITGGPVELEMYGYTYLGIVHNVSVTYGHECSTDVTCDFTEIARWSHSIA